jgi:hypothetical protein
MHYLFHFSFLSDRRQMVLFVHEFYRRFFNSEGVIIYFISVSLARESCWSSFLFMNLAGGFSILKKSLSVSFIFP